VVKPGSAGADRPQEPELINVLMYISVVSRVSGHFLTNQDAKPTPPESGILAL
jgi:hypothetical protein